VVVDERGDLRVGDARFYIGIEDFQKVAKTFALSLDPKLLKFPQGVVLFVKVVGESDGIQSEIGADYFLVRLGIDATVHDVVERCGETTARPDADICPLEPPKYRKCRWPGRRALRKDSSKIRSSIASASTFEADISMISTIPVRVRGICFRKSSRVFSLASSLALGMEEGPGAAAPKYNPRLSRRQ
jgi:hypothetical protein